MGYAESGYAVHAASLARYHDDALAPHVQALRDLERNHAGQALPAFPQGLAANGAADLFKTAHDRLGRVLGDAVRHAASSQTRLAETTGRYRGAEAANLSYLTGTGPDAGPVVTPSPPVSGGSSSPPSTAGDPQDLPALLRTVTDRLTSTVAPLGGLSLVRPVTDRLWANAVDPRHYDTAASVHAAHARHISTLRSRLDESARATVAWDGSARDGFETDRRRHLATLDDAEAHSRTLSAAYGAMAGTMRRFLSHAALAIVAFLATFSATLFVSHFFESALFLCLAEIAAFVLYLAGWLVVRLVDMTRAVQKTFGSDAA
ncbi:hypothetical protein [Actinoallomurus iriomotensis]|uniref:Uncharacterized protein n=1 Tax=Actinoallomurus iriomotensis TaxID=478107 RepID=A0A9W6RZ43_9ACTN|nr:hypothetical protein [Actinoallomurus iriomotensis]GLY84346.1 hypothetical protein Airi02_022750 [Actinoallomurus iriomotensis]